MDMYSQYGRSLPQKSIILFSELLLLWLSYWIMFKGGGGVFLGWFGNNVVEAMMERKVIIFSFSLVVFLRIGFMMMFLLKRRITWEESISIPLAFALYYVGFSLLVLPSAVPVGLVDYFAIGIFVLGSFLNTWSELQRHWFKKELSNKGKLYTGGLFKYSMHINFFGDLLWVSGYAIITRNWYSSIIVIFLFCFFAFYNIPQLDKHLAVKYGKSFQDYAQMTKKFIPFIF